MRILGLDVLRGIAIILVLFRHGDYVFFLNKGGWIGVDLFFVLSGFLVSSILFKEYQKSNSINLKRFMIRRSIKIFSSFYLFTFSFVLINYFITHQWVDLKHLVAELCYVQINFHGLNPHTWSLAIEEQFYISLAILLFITLKFKLLNKKNAIILTLTSCLLFICIYRGYKAYLYQDDIYWGFIHPYLRIDDILLGVLFSYLYYFTNFYQTIKKYLLPILIVSVIIITPPFISEIGNYLFNAYGIILMSIGFAFIVLFTFNQNWYSKFSTNKWVNPLLRVIGFIGLHSYNIYLWHGIVKKLIYFFGAGPHIAIVLYFILTISLGIFISLIIEQPILKFRNHIFK